MIALMLAVLVGGATFLAFDRLVAHERWEQLARNDLVRTELRNEAALRRILRGGGARPLWRRLWASSPDESERTMTQVDPTPAEHPQTPQIVKGVPAMFGQPKSVQIHLSRWSVRFDIETAEGTHSFIASADSGHTQGDGIWFGTAEDYEEDLWR